MATLALPYTVFSVYYQVRVAKQWCVLCLGVQVLFLVEFLLTLPALSLHSISWQGQSVAAIGWGFGLPPLAWAWLKPMLLKAASEETVQRELKRFKNNPALFAALLHQQPEMTLDTVVISPLVLGNAEASHTITVVTNLYCATCAQTHRELEALLEGSPDVKAHIVVLACDGTAGRHHQVTRHLLALSRLMPEAVHQALDAWYTQPEKEYQGWAAKFPMLADLTAFDETVRQHCDWCQRNGISATPTVYLNNYRLPEVYRLKDLRWLISSLEPTSAVKAAES